MRLQRALISAIQHAVENAGDETGEIIDNMQAQEAVSEPFSAAAYHSEQNTYSIPSFDDGGAPKQVPVKSGRAGGTSAQTGWTKEQILQHILRTFGEYGPTGKTYYGVQTPLGISYIDSTVSGEPHTSRLVLRDIKPDSQGHWTLLGTATAYPKGRYILSVVGEAPKEHPPKEPNSVILTDLQGSPISKQVPIYTSFDIGTRFVFDVPETSLTAGSPGEGGSPAGVGILPGSSHLIPLRCRPIWDTGPLSDPAYAGMTDDDLFRLFLNLCNARAIDNLDLSEKYIRDELVPLYTGPHGSTRRLSQYSRHNIQHFQENLRLLRELMLALNKLTAEIKQIRDELDDLLLTHHRVPYPLLFSPNERLEIFWPTPHPAAERDRPRVDKLLQDYQEKSEQVKHLITGILMLVREDPFLTQFIMGLEISGNSVDVPNRAAVESTLADVEDPARAQQQILEKLDGILKSIARAREKLCLDPERILDVPLVYQKVQQLLEGTNERFEAVVRERIAHHQQLKQWTDIGLGAAGLVLFVGGLILSAAGGPAGVAAYLGYAGTALGAVIALRSIDEAIFKTALSEASVEQGRGLETLEAAQTARIWAWINSTLVAVDVAASGVKSIVAARRAAALAKLSKGAEVFEESVQAGKRIPFEDIFSQARSRGQVLINETELAQLQAAGTSAGDLGRIAEELAERAVVRSGEYVKLATKVRGNQGIDLVFVRRRIFEQIFGKLADPLDASRILAQATDGQMQQLLKAIEKVSSAEDIIAVEVKFSRVGASVEDLLKTARGAGGVQYNRQWFQGLLPDMLKAADPEVRAAGRLLENIIGTNAQNIDRLARIGISLDPNGVFRLVRLNDEIINTARQIRPLFWRNWSIINRMIAAGRAGNPAEAERLLNIIRDITRRIDALDAVIGQAKRGLAASQRTLKSLEVAPQALDEVKALQAARQTPAVIDALHVATATARLHLEIVRYSMDEGEAEYRQANQSLAEAYQKHQEFQAEVTRMLDELEKIEPGAKERTLHEADEWVKQQHPETLGPVE